MAGSIVEHFAGLLDPRSEQGRRHLLTDMLGITICAVICGADGWAEVEDFDQAGKKAAIHMVSAWCMANRLALGQLATDLKSNEISAIPRLLELLDLKDAVVTIDAMGCQRDIAQKIVQGGGDYLLAVKDNHKTLHEEVRLFFDEAIAGGWEHTAHAYHQTVEKDHGRVETRRLWCTREVGWFRDRHR